MKSLPFFVMPGSALSDLREEMEIIEGERRGKLIVYRYGQRCGRGLVEHMEMKAESIDEAKSILPALWMETGLSRISVESGSEDEIIVHLQESIESQDGHKCDFARGYLAGIITALIGKRFESDEIECVSDGYSKCVINIYEVPDILKPAKLESSKDSPKYDIERDMLT